MKEEWGYEYKRFCGLNREKQVYWVNMLIYLLTIFARDCYEVEGDSVKDPIKLRRYNELLHRISSQGLKVAALDEKGMLDESFFNMIFEELLFLQVDMKYIVKKLAGN